MSSHTSHKPTQLLDLPFEMLREIFEKLSYDEVAQSRGICTSLDVVCATILNSRINKAKQLHFVLCKRNETVAPRLDMKEFCNTFLHPSKSETHFHPQQNTFPLYWLGVALELLSSICDEFRGFDGSYFVPGDLLDEILYVLDWISTAELQIGIVSHLREILEFVAVNHLNAAVREASLRDLSVMNLTIMKFLASFESQ